MRTYRLAAITVALLLAAGAQALTKEQQIDRLKLRDQQLLVDQRRSSLDSHRRELDGTRELFDQGFYSLQRYKQTLNSFRLAELEHEKALIQLEETKLELLNNATRITVVEARKYKEQEGKRSMVDIVLENISDTTAALLIDPGLGPEELGTLLKVEDILVSLSNGPVVGEPYQQKLDSLAVGQRRTLTFRLLRDEESISVGLSYLDITEQRSVILRKGGGQDLPQVNSAQFSQSGELNQKIRFDLTLERLSDEERSFVLAVVGLPQRIDYSFVADGAKVSQVKFDESISEIGLGLELEIPEKLEHRFIGRTRPFYALVTDPSHYGAIKALKERYGDDPVPPEQIDSLKTAYVRLELIPKGVGRLEVLVANRYQELEAGAELALRLEFLNRGTVAVQNIKAAIDLPYEWESEATPALIKVLEPGQRVPIDVVALPPTAIGIGDYELGIEARGQVGNENIQSPEKNITVHIAPRSNLTGNTVLIGILVLLVVGIGAVSIRVSRR
jgi:hypothetical protein